MSEAMHDQLTQQESIDAAALWVQYQALRFNSWHGCPGMISGSERAGCLPRVPCSFKGASWARSSLSSTYTPREDLYVLSVRACSRLT